VAEAHYSSPVRITGEEPWEWTPTSDPANPNRPPSANDRANPEKYKAFVESIASGKFDNQAVHGAESALSAMLGREAAYEGREVTWDKLLKSRKVWDPRLDFHKL
jgi:hypothetical protein